MRPPLILETENYSVIYIAERWVTYNRFNRDVKGDLETVIKIVGDFIVSKDLISIRNKQGFMVVKGEDLIRFENMIFAYQATDISMQNYSLGQVANLLSAFTARDITVEVLVDLNEDDKEELVKVIWGEINRMCKALNCSSLPSLDLRNNTELQKKYINLLGNHDLQEKFIIKEICRRGLNPLEKLVKNEKASIKRYFENVHDISGGTFEKAWDRLKEKNIIFINPY